MLNPADTYSRWSSQSPLGFEAGDTNLSRYVGNSPTNHTDPTGLAADGGYVIQYANGEIKEFGPQTSPSVIQSILEKNPGSVQLNVHGPNPTTVPNELRPFIRNPNPRRPVHPLDPRSRRKPASKDIERVIRMADGDPDAEKALGKLFQRIADTPSQGFYGPTKNKCFRYVYDFLTKHHPDYDKTSKGKIALGGGVLVLEPLEVPTKGDKMLVTSLSASGRVTGTMNSHGIIRGTFYHDGKPSKPFYFDLGSSTQLGNYGGADQFFFDDNPGFLVEMDMKRATPFYPEDGFD